MALPGGLRGATGAWFLGSGSCYPEPGIWDLGSATIAGSWPRDLFPGILFLVSGPRGMDNGIWDLGPGTITGTWGPGHGAGDQVPGIRIGLKHAVLPMASS